MKSTTLANQIIEGDKIVTMAQQPAKDYRLINRLRPHKGQKVWEVDLKSGEAKEAEFERTAHFEGGVTSKIIMKADTFYVCAINKQNALRKYEQALQLGSR